MASFWQDRPVFITGATGLVGGWLVKRLLAEGAEVVCLVRDWVPQSELVRSHDIEQVRVVRGDICDQAMLERALGEYEINTVFTWRPRPSWALPIAILSQPSRPIFREHGPC